MAKTYYLNVFWRDLKICDFDTMGDDPEFIYQEYSNGLLRTGLQERQSLSMLKEHLIDYCEMIYKRKRDCYKIKCTEHFMFLSAFFALHKLNYQPTFNRYIFLKKPSSMSKNRNMSN